MEMAAQKDEEREEEKDQEVLRLVLCF